MADRDETTDEDFSSFMGYPTTWGELLQSARDKVNDDTDLVVMDGICLVSEIDMMSRVPFFAWSERYVYFAEHFAEADKCPTVQSVPRHPPR